MKGWIGVDLDGTLAIYDEWRGASHIGDPIPVMVERVKNWMQSGIEVRIVTARVFAAPNDAARQVEAAYATLAIQEWCMRNIGHPLPITCTKDFGMVELWDDRCVQVEPNTGIRIDGAAKEESA